MSLAELAPKTIAEAGVAIAVRHPKTNVALGITITVCGTDSETYKRIQRKQMNRRLEQSQRSRNNKVVMTAEEIEAEAMDVLIGCTKAWATGSRPEIEFAKDEWLPCTPENVRRMYEDLPWMKEQVDQEIADRSNFLPD